MSIESLYYRIISPDRRFYHVPTYILFRIFSVFYHACHLFRLWGYQFGLFPTRRLDCRVISVGNLTLGGTGKTPIVMMIAEILRGNGHKPAILSRGYGGNSRKEVNIVCDGKSVLLAPEVAGDEPVMMAEKLKNVPVLTGSDRYQTGCYALENFNVDTLILDDGFQYIGLRRDMNILLFDHRKPFGNGNLFPAGELREPLLETKRADLICVTRYPGTGETKGVDEKLADNIPIIKIALRLDSLIDLESGKAIDAGFLQDKPVAAFCGLADPKDFQRILYQAGVGVVHYKAFPDHHRYTALDFREMNASAKQQGAELVLTTEKDAVKIRKNSFDLPFYKVSLDLEIVEGRELFNKDVLNFQRVT